MGFDQDERRRVYDLRFQQYGGLLVRVRKPGFSAFAQLTEAVLVLGDDLSGVGIAGTDKLAAWRDAFEAFAESLVSWDLTDRGRAVPVIRKSVLKQDLPFLLALTRTWYAAVVQRPDALDDDTSSDGELPTDHSDVEWPGDDPAHSPEAEYAVDEEYLSQLFTQTLPIPEPAEDDVPVDVDA